MNEGTRILIFGLFEFINGTFPEFQTLSGNEKVRRMHFDTMKKWFNWYNIKKVQANHQIYLKWELKVTRKVLIASLAVDDDSQLWEDFPLPWLRATNSTTVRQRLIQVRILVLLFFLQLCVHESIYFQCHGSTVLVSKNLGENDTTYLISQHLRHVHILRFNLIRGSFLQRLSQPTKRCKRN